MIRALPNDFDQIAGLTDMPWRLQDLDRLASVRRIPVGMESSRGDMSLSRNPDRVTRYRRFESGFLQR
jgi:hypothetical protein